jgi:hypothetical protein
VWHSWVSEENGRDEKDNALDGLLQVTKILELAHLIVIDVVIVL